MVKPYRKFRELLDCHRPARILTTMATMLVLVAWGVTGWEMWSRYTLASDNGQQQLSLLSLSLASQMERDFQTIDVVLRESQHVLQDAEGLKFWNAKAGYELFKNYATGLPLVSNLGLYDKNGYLLAQGNSDNVDPTLNFADRAYFSEFLHDPTDHLYVSQPYRSRLTGRWFIGLTRPLNNQNGFIGVVGAAIQLDRLSDIFRQQMPLETGAVSFVRTDGVLLARWPQVPEMIGKSLMSEKEMTALLGRGTNGMVRKISISDHTDRTYQYRTLKNYPLLMSVSISSDQMYANWRHESAVSLSFCAVITGMTLLLTLMLLKEMTSTLERESALRESDENLRRAQEVAHIGSWYGPLHQSQIDCSEECRRILNLTPGQILTIHLLEDLTLPEDREMLREARAALSRREPREIDIRIVSNGETRWVRILANTKVSQIGGKIATYGTIQDVTESKLAEQQIRFLGYHDALTGLPNRTMVRDRVERFMLAANRQPSKLALLYLDLDNFKTINDTLGHSMGDSLLKEVARRLSESVRETDTVSRQGGDEFLIALMNVRDGDAITHVINNILGNIAMPFSVDGHELNASFSIGVALFPEDANDFDLLLRKADLAMYKAKDAGRNTCRFYVDEMNEGAEENMRLRSGLHYALERNELQLYFQPQVRLTDGEVIGAEALLRWHHPTMGWIPPARFIPVAENSGLMGPIGAWVLDEACRQAANWQRHGFPRVGVAVNLSAIQFRQVNLHDIVVAALQNSGLEPRWLELELTESILIHSADNVLQTVRSLKQLGIEFSIDDFGTGYSSLAYLKRFDVDKLKIDQSFVRDLTTDPGDAAIVRAIIQMAHALNLRTTAEGVETEEQCQFLRREKCDALQGYLVAKPMPAEQFLLFLQQRQATVVENAI